MYAYVSCFMGLNMMDIIIHLKYLVKNKYLHIYNSFNLKLFGAISQKKNWEYPPIIMNKIYSKIKYNKNLLKV